jgi:phosphoribosylformylglycinamidine synthase
MGARPIALLDSLHFGPLDSSKNRTVMDGVVAGISSYGNSIGVPTVGGEIYFHEVYSRNPLVNVFCLGLAEKEKIFYARADGIGNSVLYVGSKTGRDGIHGATMASAEFGKETEQKRPNVQVGDPFKEKLLLEACLEVMEKGLIVGIQDMGAAGLTCSSSEMPAKSGTGISINLDLVPQREDGMIPYEIMLSESQERMLIVVERENVAEVQEVFAKWDLDAVPIGEVTAERNLKASFRGETVVDVPVDAVVNRCPVYRRPARRPSSLREARSLTLPPPPEDFHSVLLKLMASPTIADKEWVFRQYDHMVQTNTVLLPGADAAGLRIKGRKKGLAVTLDGNALYCHLDPRAGGAIAVAEACRNLACVGAAPLGVTNCLNFGNPEKPEVMWQFKKVVEGLAEACRTFKIPVTGGNVSFYNDTEGNSIYPTPVIGVVGLIDDLAKLVGPGFREDGDTIVLLGETKEELGGSEYLRAIHGLEKGRPPGIDLKQEKAVQDFCREVIKERLVQSAHDLSEGGLAVCAAECCLLSSRRIGCVIDFDEGMRPDTWLFSESQSRFLVTVAARHLDGLLNSAEEGGIPARAIGQVGGNQLVIRQDGREIIRLSVEQLYEAWKMAIPEAFSI